MSSGGYEPPHMPPGFPRFDQRRPSGHIAPAYDRHTNVSPRRRTPSPPQPLRRSFDTYIPHRPEVPFRDGAPNTFRPNSYRPDYPGNYYSRSPSPDAYSAGIRLAEPDWDRGNSWRPPPLDLPNMWTDRKAIPPSPTISARGRDTREDGPSRAFEPSETWKQSHVDRPNRFDPLPGNRYSDRRDRKSMDISPERAMRNDRAPGFLGPDRFRATPMKRDSFVVGRSDSYRPQYDNGRPPLRRDPLSPSGRRSRKTSGPFSHPRGSSRNDSPYTNRSFSRKSSPSHSVISSLNTPSRPITDSDSWSAAKPDISTRPPSRSSIASTHVSDDKSPSPSPPPPSMLPAASEDTATTPIPNELSEDAGPVVAAVSESPTLVVTPGPGAQKPTNGIASDKVSFTTTNETEMPPGLVLREKRLSLDVPMSASSDTLLHEPNATTLMSPPEGNKMKIFGKPEKAVPSENDALFAASSSRQASKPISPPPLPSLAQAPVPVPVTSNSEGSTAALANNAPALEIREIQRPIPSFRHVTPPKESGIDIDIPPTTHSPQPVESPPDSPALVTAPNTFLPPFPTIEEIPPFSEARTKEEALRIVVMTRLLCDRQTRDERVNPVLMANLSISMPLEVHPTATPDSLLERMFNKNEQEMKDRMSSYIKTRPRLAMYLESRHEKIEDKQRRLREEYRKLQENWLANCNMLNEMQKTLASEHELQHSGRTTRRSTAITDAVRSDFEMEQIIASLGVDDATDPNHLSMRNLAKIPDMISVTHGKVDYLFDDTSHLVENPKEYYAPHTGIDDWKDDEKAIFLDKYAAFPKQFGIIADFLPNKTPAQCVDYYYLHKHKFIDFRKVVSQMAPNKRKRRGMGKKKGNGLLVDIALHDMEVHRGAAGAAASVSAPVTRAPRGRKSAASLEAKKALARRGGVQFEGTPTATPTPEPESTPTRGRRRKTVAPTSTNLATTMTASASATPSRAPTPIMPPPSVPATAPPSVPPSTPTPAPPSAPPPVAPTPAVPSIPKTVNNPPPPVPSPIRELETTEQELESRPIKRVKRTRKIKSAAIVSEEDPPSPTAETDKALPPATNDASESSVRGKNAKPIVSNSQWSEDDKNLFIRLLSQYGENFKRIAASMPNKTTIQVSNYFTNNEVDLGLRAIVARAPMRSPSPDHPAQWNELPFAAGTPGSTPHPHSANASRGATPPMASLTYDGQRNGHQGFLEHTRHLSSEGVSLHPLDPASRVEMHMYPGRIRPALGAPPPAMARLGAVDPFRQPRAMFSATSSPRIAYPFSAPPEQRDGYGTKYTDGGARPYVGMAMATQAQPYYAPMYPPPTAGAAAVHSSAGLTPPPALPMHALHPFPMPAQGESPHHTSYYAGAQPVGARRDGRTQWGAYPAYYRETAPTEAGGARRAENSYPVFGSPPASAPAGRNGSLSGLSPTLQAPPASSSAASPTQRGPWP